MSIFYDSDLYPGNTLQGPPGHMPGVYLEFYPLRADAAILADFVNSYLNQVTSPDIFYAELLVPWVLCFRADYSRMTGRIVQTGIVSQEEVGFLLPLQVWHYGKPKGIAFSAPFIYVSDSLSALTGREVYGWPKSLGWLRKPNIPHNAEGRSLVDFRLQMPLIPQLFSGHQSQIVDLMQVIRESYSNPLKIPFSRLLAPFFDIAVASNNLKELFEYFIISLDYILRFGGSETIGQFIYSILASLHLGANREQLLCLPCVHLKQFRSASHQKLSDYQSLVNTPICITWADGFGMLGKTGLPGASLAGGYQIRLDQYSAQPIVETLGLQTSARFTSPASVTVDSDVRISIGEPNNTYFQSLQPPESLAADEALTRQKVTILEPVMPFWMRADLYYHQGTRLAWRAGSEGREEASGPRSPHTASRRGAKMYYNTARGGAVGTVAGPYFHNNVTVRVLPVPTKGKVLQKYCRRQLNHTGQHRFEALCDFIFVIFTRFGETYTPFQNIGAWASTEVQIGFPAIWFYRGQPLAAVLLPVYGFTDSMLSCSTYRQVFGKPSLMGKLASPRSSWLDLGGPCQEQPIFRLWSQLYPADDLAQRTRQQLLLEVLSDGQQAGEVIQSHLNGRILSITLKQIRDSTVRNQSDYQSFILSWTKMRSEPSRTLGKNLRLRLHDESQLAISRTLGLTPDFKTLGKNRKPGRIWQGNLVEEFAISDGFWTSSRMESGHAATLAWRAEDPIWQHFAPPSWVKALPPPQVDLWRRLEDPQEIFDLLVSRLQRPSESSSDSEQRGL